MAKSSKKSASKVAVAAPDSSPAKPLKKGKREAEVVIENELVSAKKQKGTEKKSEIKPEKKKDKNPKAKAPKPDSESHSDISGVAEDAPTPVVPAKNVAAPPPSKGRSEEELVVPAKKAKKEKAALPKEAEEEIEEEIEEGKKRKTKKAKKAKAAEPKKAEEEIEEEIVEDQKKKTKKAKKAKAAVPKEAEEEIEEEIEEDQKKKTKIAKKAKAAEPKKAEEEIDEEIDEDQKKKTKKAKAAEPKKAEEEIEEEVEEDQKKKTKASPEKSSGEDEPAPKTNDTDATPKEQSTGGSDGPKTLFVKNLSFQVKKVDVLEFFKPAGEVVDVRLAKSLEDDSFKGYGHVEFATAEQAEKALLELNGKELLERAVKLELAREGKKGDQKQSFKRAPKLEVFVKGFDASSGEDNIKASLTAHFASCGEISRVSVPTGPRGISTGIAYVQFVNEKARSKALELGTDTLTVEEPRPKAADSIGRFGRGRGGGGRGFNKRSRKDE